jgi:hypothetical protein
MIELRYRRRRAVMNSRTPSGMDRWTRWACAALVIALGACGEATHTVGHLKATGSLAPGAGMGAPNGSDDGSGAAPSVSGSGSRSGGSTGEPNQDASDSQSQGGGQAPLLDGGSNTIPEFDAGHVQAIVPPVCSGDITPAARRELDLYLMVDTNITIPTNAWMSLIQGLKRYVADPRATGTGVGIGFLGLMCTTDGYSKAPAGIDLLPGNRDNIERAINAAPAFNFSPLLAAIQGSFGYVRSIASAFPQRKVALVLVTDSASDSVGCGDVSSLSKAVMDGLNSTPSIPTYVVAVVDKGTFQLTIQAPNFANPQLANTQVPQLNQIAAAGGTTSVHAYNAMDELTAPATASPFADTMVQLQHDAEPCDYAVPDSVPDDMMGTWLLVNGSIDPLQRLDKEADCGDGYWLLKTSNAPDADRFAHLCSNTCADVKKAHVGLAWVSGCPVAP